MWKAALAGLVALTFSFSACAQDMGARLRSGMPSGIVLTQAHIAYFKTTLNLTPMQQRFWPAIETALHDIARQQMPRIASVGATQRNNRRVIAILLTPAAVERLAEAAQPLIRNLDGGQKLEALRLAREIGLASVVSAHN